MQSSMNPDSLICKVCGTEYNVEHAQRLDWQNSLTTRHWLQTFGIVTTMCGSSAAAWIIIQSVEGPIIRMLSVSAALLVIYVCIRCVLKINLLIVNYNNLVMINLLFDCRFLSLNTVVAYQRAKISSVNIIGVTDHNTKNGSVPTISNTVAGNLPKSQPTTV